LRYEPSSSAWSAALEARVRHLVRSRAKVAGVPEFDFDLAIVCALWDPELTSVLALPWSWQQARLENDHTIYWTGEFSGSGRSRRVVASCAQRMGTTATSVLASRMIGAFRPRYVCAVGICAGIRSRTQIGDVLIVDQSWDWGDGKWVLEDGASRFRQAPYQINLDLSLREAFRLAIQGHTLAGAREEWTQIRPDTIPRLLLGPVATGASVLGDGETIKRIAEQHRSLLGIEMEVFGLYYAAADCAQPKPTPFALKSVVDFGDGEKSDRFQGYSAYIAAAALRYLAEGLAWP